MVDSIIVSRDRTRAIIYYTDRRPLGLSHDKGLVLDLVAFFISPLKANSDITWNALISEDEVTESIDLVAVQDL